jgi:hypothetical protein
LARRKPRLVASLTGVGCVGGQQCHPFAPSETLAAVQALETRSAADPEPTCGSSAAGTFLASRITFVPCHLSAVPDRFPSKTAEPRSACDVRSGRKYASVGLASSRSNFPPAARLLLPSERALVSAWQARDAGAFACPDQEDLLACARAATARTTSRPSPGRSGVRAGKQLHTGMRRGATPQ